jgi:UDP-2,3-diacylglucosamine hydrolase
LTVLFISDLHLDVERPETIEKFVKFVEREAVHAERLFILGDLFEVWVGDDEDDARILPVLEALATLKAYEVPCYVMHGNRDFLIGDGFAQRTGCRIMTDYVTVEIYGKSMLLTHGDLLCTDDTAYMKLRTTVRNAEWQQSFLQKSITERRAIAAAMRARSKTETATKPSDIMDVNQNAVEQTMQSHGVHYLIHGHTHRPGVHRFDLDGLTGTRIVLGDWYEDGSVLEWDRRGFRLRSLVEEAQEPHAHGG